MQVLLPARRLWGRVWILLHQATRPMQDLPRPSDHSHVHHLSPARPLLCPKADFRGSSLHLSHPKSIFCDRGYPPHLFLQFSGRSDKQKAVRRFPQRPLDREFLWDNAVPKDRRCYVQQMFYLCWKRRGQLGKLRQSLLIHWIRQYPHAFWNPHQKLPASGAFLLL